MTDLNIYQSFAKFLGKMEHSLHSLKRWSIVSSAFLQNEHRGGDEKKKNEKNVI